MRVKKAKWCQKYLINMVSINRLVKRKNLLYSRNQQFLKIGKCLTVNHKDNYKK